MDVGLVENCPDAVTDADDWRGRSSRGGRRIPSSSSAAAAASHISRNEQKRAQGQESQSWETTLLAHQEEVQG